MGVGCSSGSLVGYNDNRVGCSNENPVGCIVCCSNRGFPLGGYTADNPGLSDNDKGILL